jgi:hypothetical protein
MQTLTDIDTRHALLLEENSMLCLMKDAISKINRDLRTIDMQKEKLTDSIESNNTLNSYIF